MMMNELKKKLESHAFRWKAAIQNGIMAGVTFAIDVLPMPQPMKRQVPTGGVQRPMHRFAIIMMPN